jgi:D-glycero-D-manno-heptose 1,7-bisphosphate phosphatase
MRRAIFIDRDGTISEEVGYVNHISRFKLMERTAAAVSLINSSDFLAVVVTNQAGVARGYFKEGLIIRVHEKMESLLREKNAHLDGIYYCPHHPDVGEEPYRNNCNCRKPKTGMLEAAGKDLDVDISKSFMVGDKISDVEFAHKVGAKGVLVLTGYGRGEYESLDDPPKTKPDYVAEDLYDAVKWIIENH